MTLNKRSEVKSNITRGFLDHDFLYHGNTYWVSTGNNKADTDRLTLKVTDDLERKDREKLNPVFQTIFQILKYMSLRTLMRTPTPTRTGIKCKPYCRPSRGVAARNMRDHKSILEGIIFILRRG